MTGPIFPNDARASTRAVFSAFPSIMGLIHDPLHAADKLIDPFTGIYGFVTPPYQEEHPEWEAVGFVPVTPSDFFVQWKYSDPNRTLFSYSRFDLAAFKEEEIEALAYRKSYGFEDALHELAVDTAQSTGVACNFTPAPTPPQLEQKQAINLYQITQEAINNAIKQG